MDNTRLSRRVLGEITKFNNEKNNLLKTSEPEEENTYSIIDSIMFEEDLKREIVDVTSKSIENEAEVTNRFSFRDSIIFKEEFPINMDHNTAILFQDIKKEHLVMDIKPSLQLSPPSHRKNTEANLSSRNAIVFKEDLDELYEEHIIKEEIVIGPEVLQPTADQRNADNNDAEVNNSKLNNKKQKAKGKHIFACVCGTKSSQKKWFDEHSCKKNVYVCDHCGSCNTKFIISKHMKTHQTIDRKCVGKSRASKKSKSKTQEPHICNICNKSFTYKGNLTRHLKIHLGTAKIYECDKCPKIFKSNEYLQYHITSIHLDSNSKEAKARQMACKYCSKIFVNRCQRNRHEKWHCTINSQKVYVKSSGKTEERPSRKESRTLTCDICQKKYLHKQSLIVHILLHMGKKPENKKQHQMVQCDACLQKFTKKSSLRLHIQAIHLNKKKFFCKICKKGFLRKYQIVAHEKICKVCPRNVGKSEEKERRFKCNLCPNTYLGRTGLRYHVESKHLGIKKFACQYCKVKFTRKWWLDIHEKKCKTSPSLVLFSLHS